MVGYVNSTQPCEEELRCLCSYLETIAEYAGAALVAGRWTPETGAELAVHKAYVGGLTHTSLLSREDIEEETARLATSICEELKARRNFFGPIGGDLSPEEFFASLYKDDRGLPGFWEKSPEIAEATAFWQALKDVQTFTDYFTNRSIDKDDFRSIRTMVETSLESEGLLDIWRNMVDAEKKGYTPSLPPALRTGYPPPSPAS